MGFTARSAVGRIGGGGMAIRPRVWRPGRHPMLLGPLLASTLSEFSSSALHRPRLLPRSLEQGDVNQHRIAGGRSGKRRISRSFSISPIVCAPKSKTAPKEAERDKDADFETPYNVLFCGTDNFAAFILRRLVDERQKGGEPLLGDIQVLTPRDTLQKWGAKRMTKSPVGILAEELGLQRHTLPPEGIKAFELPPPFSTSSPANLLLAISFGHFIPSKILTHFTTPSHTLNVHPSLLPLLRGSAPIQWAIANRHTKTGVSVQQLGRADFDTGDVLAQTEIPLEQHHTFATLSAKLQEVAADLLVDTLRHLPDRARAAWKQDGRSTTFAPKIRRENARVRLVNADQNDGHTAFEVEARARAWGHWYPPVLTLRNSPLVLGDKTFPPRQVHLSEVSAMSMDDLQTLDPSPDLDEIYNMLHIDDEGIAVGWYSQKFDALVIRFPTNHERPEQTALLVKELKIDGKSKPKKAREWIEDVRDRTDPLGCVCFESGRL